MGLKYVVKSLLNSVGKKLLLKKFELSSINRRGKIIGSHSLPP